MARCSNVLGLKVHHKRRDGGNGIDNTEVLCQVCHEAAESYGTTGASPPEFSEAVKDGALINSGIQCECTRTGGCH